MAVKHAVLSASSSERWLNCPPSARLCEAYEDKGSDYAAEGTDAHALCEFRLKQVLGIPADNPIENLSWYNEEMEDCAAGYAAYVSELLETAKQTCADPVILIEQRVDFSRWVQDGFGTADQLKTRGPARPRRRRQRGPSWAPALPLARVMRVHGVSRDTLKEPDLLLLLCHARRRWWRWRGRRQPRDTSPTYL